MIDPTTQAALRARKTATQCALARELGEPVATISDILAGRHNHVSLRTENRVRQKLGLAKLRGPLELLPNEKIVVLRPKEQRDKRRCIHLNATTYEKYERLRGEETQEAFMQRLFARYLE